jgi:hypothetical protein
MSVILATWEAEIRRIMVQSQSRKIVHKTLSQKYSTQNRASDVAQVGKHLPYKCEALNSNPNTIKKKNTHLQHIQNEPLNSRIWVILALSLGWHIEEHSGRGQWLRAWEEPEAESCLESFPSAASFRESFYHLGVWGDWFYLLIGMFCCAEVPIQGPKHDRQVLYHWVISLAQVFSFYF